MLTALPLSEERQSQNRDYAAVALLQHLLDTISVHFIRILFYLTHHSWRAPKHSVLRGKDSMIEKEISHTLFLQKLNQMNNTAMDFVLTFPYCTPSQHLAQTFLFTPYCTPSISLFYGHYMCHKMAGLPIRLVAPTIPLNGITTSPSCWHDSDHFCSNYSNQILLTIVILLLKQPRFSDWRGKRHWFFLLPFKKPTRLSRRPRPTRHTRCAREADRPVICQFSWL